MSEPLIENLGKYNFWNEMVIKYPKIMGKFCTWIDEYKKKNNWNVITGSNIKYHDLPLAMQAGIFIQFQSEICPTHTQFDLESIKEQIEDYFEDCEDEEVPH